MKNARKRVGSKARAREIIGRPKPLVTVLVITLNELPHLKKVVASIRRQSIARKVEIVVCDNGSTDGTAEWVARQGLKYYNAGRNTGTPVFNKGLALAEGDFVFIGATDMAFKRDCFERLARHLEANSSCGMAVPLNINGNDRARVDVGGSWLSRCFYGGAVHANPGKVVGMPFSGVGLLRRSAIAAAGGFIYEPSFFIYAEDVELGFRLDRAGFSTQLLPTAVLYHYGYQARKIFTPFQLTCRIERNMLVTMLTHLPKRFLLFSLPYAVLMRLLVTLKDLARRDWQRARARLWVLFSLPAIIFDAAKHRNALSQTLKNPWRHDYFGRGVFDERPVWRIFFSYMR